MEIEYVRSLRSNEKCYVRFYNVTERTIELTWVNYTGQYVRYQILNKGNYVDVTTYKTHPWIAKDVLTKDVLHVDKQFVYQPKTTIEFLKENYPARVFPEHHEARVRAYITLPVYSLRYASLLCLRNYILEPDHVDSLILPHNLGEELKKVVVKRNRECAMQSVSAGHL